MNNKINKYEDIFDNVDVEFIPSFIKLTGVTFEGRQDIIKKLKTNDKLKLIRKSDNKYDKCAIEVISVHGSVGWIPQKYILPLAQEIDNGISWIAKVKNIIGENKDSLGIVIDLITLS
jgi:hypothetical protein